MDKISIVTPLMRVNHGSRRRNWKVVHGHLVPLIEEGGHEWIVPEQGSTQGARRGVTKVPVYGPKNRSQMRNIGWQNASNDMICFLDGDLVMEHQAWQRAFEECWEYDCYSPYIRGVFLGRQQTRNRASRIMRGEWNFRVPKSRRWNLCGGICFIRRSVLEKIQGWDDRFTSWGYEDRAIEKLVRAGGFNWHLDSRHIALHLFHSTTRGSGAQRRAMRRVYRRFYACKNFEQIMDARKSSPPSHLGGHELLTHVDRGALRLFYNALECRSLLDVGCGTGGQVSAAENGRWYEARGVDGDDTIDRDCQCEIIDFTKHKYESDYRPDLVWCCEFVEHVEEKYIENYIPALTSGNYLVLTHALPKAKGHHHVNCQPSEYWKNILSKHGMEYSQQLTGMLRRASTMRRKFIQRTGMVFANTRNQHFHASSTPSKSVLIYRGIGNNKWAESLSQRLRERGATVIRTMDASKIRDHDEVIIWNGELEKDKKALAMCKNRRIPHCFLEVGYFSQQTHLMLSRNGSTGGSLLSGERLSPMTESEEQMLQEFFERYAGGRKREPCDHVIAMLQVQSDTAIKNYSPVPTMQEFVDLVETRFPNDEVRFKAHPKARDIRLRTRSPIIREGNLWDHLLTSKLCVGINSTSLYEAALAGVPVLSIGGCVLAEKPTQHREIVREVVLRQMPLANCDDFDERVMRSLGRTL